MDFMTTTALNNWRDLNKMLGSFNEQQIMSMLEEELSTRKRKTIIVRLHQRYTAVRAERERREILEAIGQPD